MRVYAKPIPATLSRAMHRVSYYLEKYAPPELELEFVDTPEKAELQVMHVVWGASLEHQRARQRAVIQYCYASAGGNEEYWHRVFDESALVWSYYDLAKTAPRFYYSPLGVDPAVFRWSYAGWEDRHVGVVTTGTVSAWCAEAIEDVALAASSVGMKTAHVGPPDVVGMTTRPNGWQAHTNISDQRLANIYGKARWVSGLRHVEGFELPMVEGIACGARPLAFDRPEMRKWFDGLAVFVKERSGEELVSDLATVFSEAKPVTMAERTEALSRFDWDKIVRGFWEAVCEEC